VATAVLKDIVRRDPSHPLIGQDLQQHILNHMWEPVYLPYRRV
jgi:malate dehydrogenase (oxaloacetate-decarboxylating)